MSEYPIYTEEGTLFCKCCDDNQGNIILISKNGRIPFNKLAKRVYHHEYDKTVREKRADYNKHREI